MRLTCLAWSAFALACLGCDFSPGLGDGYPACVDGACLRAGCECLGGQVCVPQDPREGPEACQPTACEEGESCDDGDACTLAERCAAGQCQGGTQVDCDDQDACTQDGCDSFTGCTHDAITGLPAEGPPGDPGCANLLDDDCDGQTDGLDPGCVACSEDSECEDLDPCTQDSCTGGACANLPAGDGQACDDSDGCTAGETCLEGDCQGGSLRDVDGDGYADIQCGGDDCDDQLGAVNPGSPEVGPGSSACADGLDNDCDGAVDYADPSCQGGPPAGPLCGPLGWCWENPLPQGNDLLGVWGQGAQAWGVGPNGIIVRFDAAGLALEPLDRFDDLRAIHGEGSTLVTVGGNRAYQRVAGDWIGVVFEQSVEAFFDVWVEAGGVLWLAGREGAVWRFESNTGAPFPPPSGADVLAVSAVEGIPWAADSVGARFRWAGSAWEDTAVDTDGLVMLDLAAFRNTQPQPETEALAIGGGGRVEVYREGVWNAQLDLAPELYGLFWDPGAGGLVAGDGVLYVQDDPLSGQWQPQLGAVGEAYRGVWSQLGPDGVKDGVIAVGLRGALYGKAGTTALSVTRRFQEDLHAVSCVPGRSWAVGSGGRLVEITVDENGVESWAAVQHQGVELHGVWGGETGAAWAVGAGGAIFRMELPAYVQEDSGVAITLRAVVGIPDAAGGAAELWAVGNGGTVLRRLGETWTPVEKSTVANLHAAAAFGSEVWAVGDEGVVLRCSGATCTRVAALTSLEGTPAQLRAVVMASAEEGYAGAEDGTIYRYATGPGWHLHLQPVPGRPIWALTARYIEGAGWDWWAVGDHGLALNLSPIGMQGWHQVQIGANVDLRGLCAWTPANQSGAPPSLRAVGAGGAVLIQR